MTDTMRDGRIRDIALAGAVAAGVLLGGAGFADAAPQSHSFSVSDTVLSDVFGFDQFNPALGTLTQVTITTLGYGVSHISIADIIGGEFGTSVTVSQAGTFRVSDPNGNLMTSSLYSFSFCTVSGSPTGNCNNVDFGIHLPDDLSAAATYTAAGDLAAFIGNGTVNLTVAIDDYFGSIDRGIGFFSPEGNISGSQNVASYTPTIQVEYTYTATVDTPEPASLALMGVGLLGLALRRRR